MKSVLFTGRADTFYRDRLGIGYSGLGLYVCTRCSQDDVSFFGFLRDNDTDFTVADDLYVGNVCTAGDDNGSHLVHSATDETEFASACHRTRTEYVQADTSCKLVGIYIVALAGGKGDAASRKEQPCQAKG